MSAAAPATPAWRGWLLLIAGVALAAGAMAGSAILGAMIPEMSPLPATALFYLMVFAPLVVAAALFGWLDGVVPWRLGDKPDVSAALGLLAGLGGFGLALGYSWLSGGVVAGAGSDAAAGVLIGAMLLTLFQVASEELFFRGWLLPSLSAKTGVIAGILLSSVLFAAFHILGGVRGPVALINLMLGGVWFALLAWRSGGIAAPLAAHAAWNIVEDSILGLVPNPGVGALGSVIDLDLAGPMRWGGSVEGLNTSIGMTIVLVALIVPLVWMPRVSSPNAPALRRPDPAA